MLTQAELKTATSKLGFIVDFKTPAGRYFRRGWHKTEQVIHEIGHIVVAGIDVLCDSDDLSEYIGSKTSDKESDHQEILTVASTVHIFKAADIIKSTEAYISYIAMSAPWRAMEWSNAYDDNPIDLGALEHIHKCLKTKRSLNMAHKIVERVRKYNSMSNKELKNIVSYSQLNREWIME